jgi:hypothetical protein
MKRTLLSLFELFMVIVLLVGCVTPPASSPTPETMMNAPTQIETSVPTAATEAPVETPLEINGKYLMAFHDCDTALADCHDWQNHRVYLAQSMDGMQWSIVPNWEPYSGSVPDVIRRDETLYLYTPGQLVRYHLDTGILEGPLSVKLDGAEGFVDPSVILDENGNLVLFFLYGRKGGDPAGCMPDEATCENRFGSATEVEGSDGEVFALDEGDRVKVTLSSSGPIRTASDPDIFYDGSQFILYIAYGPSISAWTSPDLHGTFTPIAQLPGGMLTNDSGGVAAGYFDPDSQQYWTFAHKTDQNVPAIIRRTVHDDLTQQLTVQEWSEINGISVGLTATTSIESPGFAVNEP